MLQQDLANSVEQNIVIFIYAKTKINILHSSSNFKADLDPDPAFHSNEELDPDLALDSLFLFYDLSLFSLRPSRTSR